MHSLLAYNLHDQMAYDCALLRCKTDTLCLCWAVVTFLFSLRSSLRSEMSAIQKVTTAFQPTRFCSLGQVCILVVFRAGWFLERQLFSELLTSFAGAKPKKLTVSSTTVRKIWAEVYSRCNFAL